MLKRTPPSAFVFLSVLASLVVLFVQSTFVFGQRQPARIPGDAPAAPMPRSELKSLAAANKTEDKCEVLLSWLESGKMEAAPTARGRYIRGTELLSIFRDEPMMMVFGMPYDKTENRWRLELHEKTISRCLGIAAPSAAASIFNIPDFRRPNQTMQQYRQQFAQYRQLLDQAFLGRPGTYEPTAIMRHVQQFRAQTTWMNQTLNAAATSTPTRESFDWLAAQQRAVNSQLSLLTVAEKARVMDALARRQGEIAPRIVEGWLQEASRSPKNVASAKVLHNGRAGMTAFVNALDSSARTAFEERYKRLVESMLAASLQAETAKLRALPASLAGVQQLMTWKAAFNTAFGDLRTFSAVEAATYEYQQTRTRILTGAIPVWRKQVETIPVDDVAITAKRREMEPFFSSYEDRASPLFAQYEAPLRAKEEQLRLRVEAARRKQQEAENAALARQQAAASARPAVNTSGAPLKAAAKGTCDALAGHPEDKGRVGAGVADENIVPAAAIETCVRAVKQSPTVARFYFQLGRAYWAAKQYDEALDAFLKAEENNYTPAYFYLAQAYEQGVIEGEQADPAMARNLYMMAASEGFEPAVRAYQSDMAAEPDFSEFKQPDLLKALYQGDMAELNRNRSKAILYMRGIYSLLEEQESFEGADATCIKLVDAEISKALTQAARKELGLPAGGNPLSDGFFLYQCAQQPGCIDHIQRNAPVGNAGTDDIYLFAYDYGTCAGAAVGKIHATIKRFVQENLPR